MKILITAMMLILSSAAQAECLREYPKPVELNESDLTEEERKLLAELREIEKEDPELTRQAREVAENWESYGFTECPVPELD